MKSEPQVRVLVADDQEPFRRAARAVIAAAPGFTLVGEASSGEEAVSLAAALLPDLVLLDVRMPGIGGAEAARRIAGAEAGGRIAGPLVVLVSTHPARGVIHAAPVRFLPKEDFGPSALRALWHGRASAADRTGRGAPP
jgi:DNA-binding NarL/FixJ family response regulator